MSTSRAVPFVRIVHQPSSVYRMRYKKENRSTFLYAENATQSQIQNQPTSSSPSTTTTTTTTTSSSSTSISGSAPATTKKAVRKKGGGVSNDAPDGTFPKIEIVNGCGPATLIVSCVSKKEPYHVHPHKLIGNSCRSGVAILNIGEGETFFELSGISIEYTKQSEIEESINELKSKNVDPFNVGFGFDRKNIDQTQLRLCFQVYLRDSLNSTDIIRDKYHILEPVVSQIISNSSRKATLLIERTSKLFAPADGNGEVTIFIKRLEKDQKNLWVKFFDDSNWCETFKIVNIHYQSAMIIKPPAYKKSEIDKPITVWLKLYVPFINEEEKLKYMKKLKNDEENDEDDNDEDNGENGEKQVVPDGKYESREVEFEYVPFVSPKRKLDANLQLYDTTDHVDKEGHNEINEETRKKLKMRNLLLQSSAVGQSNTHQTPSSSSFPDELILSNSISEAPCDPTSSINNIFIDDKKLTISINSEYPSETITNNTGSNLNTNNVNDEPMQKFNENNLQFNTETGDIDIEHIDIDQICNWDFSKLDNYVNFNSTTS